LNLDAPGPRASIASLIEELAKHYKTRLEKVQKIVESCTQRKTVKHSKSASSYDPEIKTKKTTGKNIRTHIRPHPSSIGSTDAVDKETESQLNTTIVVPPESTILAEVADNDTSILNGDAISKEEEPPETEILINEVVDMDTEDNERGLKDDTPLQVPNSEDME